MSGQKSNETRCPCTSIANWWSTSGSNNHSFSSDFPVDFISRQNYPRFPTSPILKPTYGRETNFAVNSLLNGLSLRLHHMQLLYGGFKKYLTVRLLGTGFETNNCISEHCPQGPYRDISETHCRISNWIVPVTLLGTRFGGGRWGNK
jgi:hypothetical protein